VTDVEWRASRDGWAHICPPGWATALCGAQTVRPVEQGAPCGRCMRAATERLADE
jgi:hypothetical protein